MTTHRIESLSDCIFAFSMTLLVMNFNFPDPGRYIDEQQVVKVLFTEISKFDRYILTFILLAIMWITHHQQFHHIKRTDRRFLWIQILILMFIVTTPFTAAWMSTYNHLRVTNIIFDVNIFILGLLFFLSWFYATNNRRLVDENLDKRNIRAGIMRSSLTMAVSLIAFTISLFHPSWSNYAYISILVMASLKPFQLR